MIDEQITLARRAVACKGWCWMNGMLLLGGDRVTERTIAIAHGSLPDLTDPATLGCLLALVREAWECAVILTPDYEYDDEARQGQHPTGWRAVETARWMTVGDGGTESEALVAALEAATKAGRSTRS